MKMHTPLARHLLVRMNHRENSGFYCLVLGLSIFLARTIAVSAINCFCEGLCPSDQQNGTCVLQPGGYCFSTVEEVRDTESGMPVPEYSFGCLEPGDTTYMLCNRDPTDHLQGNNTVCCNDTNLCNKDLWPMYTPRRRVLPPTVPPQRRIFLIIGVALSVGVMVFILAVVLIYCLYRRKDTEPYVITPEATLMDLIDKSSGSGSGAALLVQRTIAQQVTLYQSVGKGRYGEVWLAHWRNEKVAVKVFYTLEEDSWVRETKIYQTVLLRHENILGFIAADIKGTGSCTQMMLITDYYEKGSLYDYLQTIVLDYPALIAVCLSIASGIAHLHSEIGGFHGKPAIAHRDIKSRNILVKCNGQCAIADFGLAVRFRSKIGLIDTAEARVGTRRYMAPEVLDESLNTSSFHAFAAADMYSMGLVLWEVCRRCASDDKFSVAEPYALPYHDVVPSDPDFEEMKLAVCDKRLRPIIPARWENDRILSTLSRLMIECWHTNPGVRLTALRVKKTMMSKLHIYNTVQIV